jgi:hypothetical protein
MISLLVTLDSAPSRVPLPLVTSTWPPSRTTPNLLMILLCCFGEESHRFSSEKLDLEALLTFLAMVPSYSLVHPTIIKYAQFFIHPKLITTIWLQFLDPILLSSEVYRETHRRVQFLTAAKSMKRKVIGFFARLMDSSEFFGCKARNFADCTQSQSLEQQMTPHPALDVSTFLRTILA